MYIQREDLNSYVSPKDKDWLRILVKKWCNISRKVRPNGPTTEPVLSPCGSSQLLCDPELQIRSDRETSLNL